jgi:translation elongation factor EF-G
VRRAVLNSKLTATHLKHIGLDFDEHDGTPESRVSITVAVPEEFIGFSIGEVNRRIGRIEAIEHKEQLTLVHGDIPANQFTSLATEIESFTDGAGKVTLRE